MSNEKTISVKISVGDQDFRVRIPPDEKAFYHRVAKFTESTFQEVSGEAVTGGPRAWAMTAFQIACELLEEGGDEAPQTDKKDLARIERMIERIDAVTADP